VWCTNTHIGDQCSPDATTSLGIAPSVVFNDVAILA
jgi:hypothetical protein